jgi:hypothetical protein
VQLHARAALHLDKRASDIYWIGSCASSSAGLDIVEKRKSLGFAGNLTLIILSNSQPSQYSYRLSCLVSFLLEKFCLTIHNYKLLISSAGLCTECHCSRFQSQYFNVKRNSDFQKTRFIHTINNRNNNYSYM